MLERNIVPWAENANRVWGYTSDPVCTSGSFCFTDNETTLGEAGKDSFHIMWYNFDNDITICRVNVSDRIIDEKMDYNYYLMDLYDFPKSTYLAEANLLGIYKTYELYGKVYGISMWKERQKHIPMLRL